MNYSKIIESAYGAFSIKKSGLYLLFFWIVLPMVVFLPWAVENNIIHPSNATLVLLLAAAMTLCAVVGFVILTRTYLAGKKIVFPQITLKKLVLLFPLVFVELWYLLVWNLKNKYIRLTQIILLTGIFLFSFYYSTFKTPLIFSSLVVFLFMYVFIVFYNFIRLMYTVPLYLSTTVSIFDAPKQSWYLTHNKSFMVLSAVMQVLGVVLIIFLAVGSIIAFVSNIILSQYFVARISEDLALRLAYVLALAPALICYHSAISEIYSQLVKEKVTHTRITTILANKVLRNAALAPRRSFAKKKKRK